MTICKSVTASTFQRCITLVHADTHIYIIQTIVCLHKHSDAHYRMLVPADMKMNLNVIGNCDWKLGCW